MMGETIIRKGVKIDNLVQIGHNVEIGANTILCGQVGIAGSTKLGEWCVMTGQVGVADHLTVADHTIAASQAGIATHIRKPGQTIMGYPAYDAKQCSRKHRFQESARAAHSGETATEGSGCFEKVERRELRVENRKLIIEN